MKQYDDLSEDEKDELAGIVAETGDFLRSQPGYSELDRAIDELLKDEE